MENYVFPFEKFQVWQLADIVLELKEARWSCYPVRWIASENKITCFFVDKQEEFL